MNYSEMTDFEINCAVALCLGMGHAFFFPKSESDFCEGLDVGQRGPIWQSSKHEVNGYRVSNGNCFNPCNSWTDAGPIIEENRIAIIPESDGTWFALGDPQIKNNWRVESTGAFHNETTPLRAAMIVFLMMQEDK